MKDLSNILKHSKFIKLYESDECDAIYLEITLINGKFEYFREHTFEDVLCAGVNWMEMSK